MITRDDVRNEDIYIVVDTRTDLQVEDGSEEFCNQWVSEQPDPENYVVEFDSGRSGIPEDELFEEDE